MRIGIDARFYGMSSQGIGRYVDMLTRHIAEEKSEHTFVLFVLSNAGVPDLPSNFEVRRTRCTWYSLSEQLIWPWQIYSSRLDLMHFTHFTVPVLYRSRFIVTIHDLILLEYPTTHASTRHPLFFYIKYACYLLVLRHAIRASSAIIAVSGFTATEIEKRYHGASKKTHVIYLAPALLPTAETKPNQAIPLPYVLYVGNAYPHKNLDFLVDAFRDWNEAQKKYTLLLIGKGDYFYARLEARIDSGCRISILRNVTDQELQWLYGHATAYIFPSVYEGFGLPPLEAMSRGIPVATSSHQPMPEILRDAALYFDPADRDTLKNALSTITSDIVVRKKLIEKGTARSSEFSWKFTAQKTLSLYAKLKN